MSVVCMWRKTVAYGVLRQLIVGEARPCTGDQDTDRTERKRLSSSSSRHGSCYGLQGLFMVPLAVGHYRLQLKAVNAGQELMTVVLTILN
jgi:hypothetical protein